MSDNACHCWSCGDIITKATSFPTIDPDKRICWHCDGKIHRKPASSFNQLPGLLALLQEGCKTADAR
jgi:hypothetical protein